MRPYLGAGTAGLIRRGVRGGDKFEFAGKVGTGFNGKMRAKLLRELAFYARPRDPFVETPREYRQKVKWVNPSMVVQVKFTEFIADGLLRHPSFQGVREDKPAREVKLEVSRKTPAPGMIAKSRSRWRKASNGY